MIHNAPMMAGQRAHNTSRRTHGARQHGAARPALVHHARGPRVHTAAAYAAHYERAAHLGELGFSLKPPKWARKAATSIKRAVTLKNVLKAGAIVGAAVIAGPAVLSVARVALPAVARGGLALVRGAGSAVRAAEHAAANVITKGIKAVRMPAGPSSPIDMGEPSPVAYGPPAPDSSAATQVAQAAANVLANNAAQQQAAAPSAGYTPSASVPTGYSASPAPPEPVVPDAQTQPSQAGIGSSALVPVALGIGALLLLNSGGMKKRGARS